MAIRRSVRRPRREVEFGGRYYKVKSNSVEVPNLAGLPRIDALLWLNEFTYARGFSRPNPLAGFAGAISFNAQ